MTGLTIQQRQDGNVGVLTLQGDISAELIPQLQRAAQACVAAGAKHLLVNLRELGFMDSASLGALLHLGQARSKQGGRVVLCSLSPAFQRLMEASGLTGQFTLAPDEVTGRRLLA